jgi:UDP-glucose 4-epimerase
MKCLVTGGAGFIGSHLVDRLVAEGHEVTVIDDLSTGRRENINPAARLVRGLAEFVSFWGHPEDYTWDWCFHLAGKADVVPSIEHPVAYFQANITGTQQLLEFARRGGVKKFMYAASSSCYGVNPPTPTREDDPIKPAHPYALSKWMGEELVLHYGQVYKLPVVSLRLFNVYGPRARTSGAYGAVMGTFLAQRANGAPLTIVGDGTQHRDFVHVRDVVNAFMLAATSNVPGVFNIGSGDPLSINELAAIIGGPTVQVPWRAGEPKITCAETGKALVYLGWEPTTPIRDGLAELLEDLTPWKTAPVWTPDSIAKATEQWHKHLG